MIQIRNFFCWAHTLSKSLHYIQLFLAHRSSLTVLRCQSTEQLALVTVKSFHDLSFSHSLRTPKFQKMIQRSRPRNVFLQFQAPVNYSQMKGDQIVFPAASSSNEQPTGFVRIHQYLLFARSGCDDFV